MKPPPQDSKAPPAVPSEGTTDPRRDAAAATAFQELLASPPLRVAVQPLHPDGTPDGPLLTTHDALQHARVFKDPLRDELFALNAALAKAVTAWGRRDLSRFQALRNELGQAHYHVGLALRELYKNEFKRDPTTPRDEP